MLNKKQNKLKKSNHKLFIMKTTKAFIILLAVFSFIFISAVEVKADSKVDFPITFIPENNPIPEPGEFFFDTSWPHDGTEIISIYADEVLRVQFYAYSPVIGIGFTISSYGNHTIEVVYPGDEKYNPAYKKVIVTVGKINLNSTVTSTPNPSVYGQTVILDAALSFIDSVGTVVPTGTFSFYDSGTLLGTVPVVNFMASLSVSTLDVGTHNIYAEYSGDTNYNNVTSNNISQIVNKGDTQLNLTSSCNPSEFGNEVIFTAIVSSTMESALEPTGIVSFFDGATLLGVSELYGGVAKISFSDLTIGSHEIVAVYDGNMSYNGCSGFIFQTINKIALTLTLSSDNNPSKYGDTVNFTAVLSSTASKTVDPPTGTVSFYDNDNLIGTEAVSSWSSELTTSELNTGDHTIRTVYSGDVNYNSVSATIRQTVNPIYIVHYINRITDNSIIPDKTGSGSMNETITETAVSIEGYVVIGPNKQSVTLNNDINNITFRYLPVSTIILSMISIVFLFLIIMLIPFIITYKFKS